MTTDDHKEERCRLLASYTNMYYRSTRCTTAPNTTVEGDSTNSVKLVHKYKIMAQCTSATINIYKQIQRRRQAAAVLTKSAIKSVPLLTFAGEGEPGLHRYGNCIPSALAAVCCSWSAPFVLLLTALLLLSVATSSLKIRLRPSPERMHTECNSAEALVATLGLVDTGLGG